MAAAPGDISAAVAAAEADARAAPVVVPVVVLSIDVGRKNLALCAVQAGTCPRGTQDLVRHWTVTTCEPDAAGIATCLNALEWARGADEVVIERQPNRNHVMTRLQHYLEMYFVMHAKPVTVQDAKHKLAFAAGTPWWPAHLADNWSYHTRKKLSVRTAAAFLDATPQDPQFKQLFAGTKKADDLADALLQGMAYCHHVRPLELHKRQQRQRPAVAHQVIRARKPTAAQLASGRFSKPNVVHFLKACPTKAAAAAVAQANKALAKALAKHFVGGLDNEQLMHSLGLADAPPPLPPS